MNGIKLNKSEQEHRPIDVFSFKDKELKIRRGLALKYILLIICTNSLTYLMTSDHQTIIKDLTWHNKVKKNHKRMIISLELFTPLNKDKPTKVMLFNHRKNIRLEEVLIIKQKTDSNDLSEESSKYIVEVHEKYLKFMALNPKLIFNAYPKPSTQFPINNKSKNILTKRKKNYEIIL